MRLAGQELHAPFLVELEVVEAFRRNVRAGELSLDRSLEALDDFAELSLVHYPLGALRDRVWELRDNLTSYDAVYVALAEALGAPVVTCDRGLARAPGVRATVELFEL
jgi:predicted nucleic acid-binding protein